MGQIGRPAVARARLAAVVRHRRWPVPRHPVQTLLVAPLATSAARSGALVMSLSSGKPAYGGTPSDETVVRAIRDLKARGYAVVFYPFVFMDVPAGNALPNPYGGTGQPVYPWRGRITCHPAAGQSGTVDKTATAGTQVAAFFGACLASHVSVSVNASTDAVTTSYSGPAEWGLRRFILHYARLCAAVNTIDAGTIDAFLIGSEFRALCSVRDSATNFPAVARLKTLAADVKSILGGGVKVSYAADWSDYNGYRPADGSNDVFFHLDPLGAPVVLLNEAVAKIDGKPAERLAARFYRWGPQALDIADPAWQQTTFATKAVGRMPSTLAMPSSPCADASKVWPSRRARCCISTRSSARRFAASHGARR